MYQIGPRPIVDNSCVALCGRLHMFTCNQLDGNVMGRIATPPQLANSVLRVTACQAEVCRQCRSRSPGYPSCSTVFERTSLSGNPCFPAYVHFDSRTSGGQLDSFNMELNHPAANNNPAPPSSLRVSAQQRQLFWSSDGFRGSHQSQQVLTCDKDRQQDGSRIPKGMRGSYGFPLF